MNGNAQLIEKLTESRIYRDYQRAYTETTQLPIALRPVESWRLPFHGKCAETPFCAMLAEKSRSCVACLQLQEKLARSATEGPCTMTCSYGLSEVAVPVKLGEKTVGFLQT